MNSILGTEIPSLPSNRSSGALGVFVGVGGIFVGVVVGDTGVEVKVGESVDWVGAGVGVGFGTVNKPHASNASDVRARQVVLGKLLLGMKILLWGIQAYS